MATPIYTGLDNGLKPKMASVSLKRAEQTHCISSPCQKTRGGNFNGKKMVAQAFVKQIKKGWSCLFWKFLCRVSRELAGSR